MAYHLEKNGEDQDLVFDGWEQGIAPSPHKGIANIQNGNIATEMGEVMASFGRSQASMTSTSSAGSLTFVDSTHVGLSISGSNNKFKGMWITVSSSSHTGELNNGNYWVVQTSSGGTFQLSASYGGAVITGYTSGLTATITLMRTMTTGIAYQVEPYFLSGVLYYRYYVLDSQGLVWMYDTRYDIAFYDSDDVRYWVLPDTSITYWSSDTTPSGLLVMNGTLVVMSGNKFWVKPTVRLDASYTQMTNAIMMSASNSNNPHFGLYGHQGRGYYTDGSFVGSIFPDTSLLTGVNNVQSYASWTGSSTTGTISNLYSGTIPSTGANVGVTGFSRIPAVFFTASGGALPSSMNANTVYYISYSTANANFEVYDALTGGSAKDIATGASGTQFYNTFWVIGTHAGAYGDTSTTTFTPGRLTLPNFEVSTTIAEVGNTALIGTKSTVIYPWNQYDALPSGLINLPESYTYNLLTVNQMAYIFAGSKGNIYITDGSVASLVLKFPDYCAGIAGTASSYIEPTFTWGGAGYVRGRVYFGILDQTSTKSGNCGGVWSFYPTQNLYVGQDTGIALRLENQNSYGTYNGYASLIIPFPDQSGAKAPQYWSTWKSALTSPAYGIDKTATTPIGTVIVETDLANVGTVLNKYTSKQLEYKLAAPLTAGETVQAYWRVNATDAWTSWGTVQTPDGPTGLSGYFQSNFQGGQWIQIRLIMTPLESTSTSWCRLTEIRMR